jgi:hypothetical protein
MSGLNGTLDRITRPSQASGYAPTVYIGSRLGLLLDGRPRFTWLEAERMRYDPQVQLGLRILRAPLYGVTWKVNADQEAVGRWVDRELSRVYRRILPRIVRAYEYGVACGEVTYRAKQVKGRTRVHFSEFIELHPRDARPIVYDVGRRAGKLAAMHVTGGRGNGSGSIYLDPLHSFWFKGEAEFQDWWGRPRMAGAYEPWLEKRGRHGAIDDRRLFYQKCAFRGPRIRYPIGQTNMGTAEAPVMRSNQDIARELVEKFENGGVLALPNTTDDKGNYLWSWEDPQGFADVAGLLEYPKQLDRELLIGFGIPPELVEAASVGSGYSGRAIPAQVFFTSMDEFAGLVVEAIDRQIIRKLVRLNFGKTGYEVKVNSLAQLMAQSGPGGAPGAGMPGAGAGGAAAGGGGGQWQPYQGPRGGQGVRDSQGHVRYTHDPSKYLRLSQKARARKGGDPLAMPTTDPALLWARAGGPVYAERGGVL